MFVVVFSALLSFGAVLFAGGDMDQDGCRGVHAGACSAAGVQIDPDGRTHAAAKSGDKGWGLDPNGSPRAASTDQGSMIDPDGKPSR